ncbi:MAG: serine/threonine protein kinase [Myxococcales bacterium]|nr:serine/threonine protein kinase [Myxococcales bacterium]
MLEQRYRIDDEVGRGGMGVVYRGTDLTLQRPVAIKTLMAAHAEAETIDSFMREARALASIEHPRVVPVYAVGRHGGAYYMVMKFIEGRPLSEILKTDSKLAPERVRRLLLESLDALGALHDRGLVHRDVKPGNLMVEPTGGVTLMDLGISREVSELGDQTGTHALGTPRYMPPEMIRNAAEDGRADLYSLGVIAWQCLAGRPPFDGPTPMAILFRQAHEPAEPLRKVAPEAPKALVEVVEQAMAKDPEDRFASAAEMRAALTGASAAGGGGGRLMLMLFGAMLVAGGLTAGLWVNATAESAEDAGHPPPPPPPDAAVVDAKVAVDAAVADAKAPVDAQVVDAAPKPKPAPVETVSIKISSTPPGAWVFAGGRRLGRTPFTLDRPKSARGLSVTFERRGHEKAEEVLNLRADGSVHVKLEPLFDLVP